MYNYMNVGDFSMGMIVFLAIIAAMVYVYTSLAWMKIGKNQKYSRPWLAWIPFANISMIFQMGGFHWAWVLIIAIPMILLAIPSIAVAGIILIIPVLIAILVLMIISIWRIFEKAKYPAWLSLILVLVILPIVDNLALIGYLIIIGLVAWKKP